VAIHWDYARDVLRRADGVLATVGLAAETGEAAPEATAGNGEMGSPPAGGLPQVEKEQ
jgi:hypothetical protein